MISFSHKGYAGVVTDADPDTGYFHGKVTGLRDVITFEAKSYKALEREFRTSVDEYLKFCEETGTDPEKPVSGTLSLRMSEELHRKVSAAAQASGMSINSWVKTALEKEVERETVARQGS